MAFIPKVTVVLAAASAALGSLLAEQAVKSPSLDAAIKAGLPAYLPQRLPVLARPASAPIIPSLFVPGAAPADEVQDLVRMPKVVVREEPMPSSGEVLTTSGAAQLAMEEYLGDPDGLDRGFLNRFTIQQLWAHIPVLGYFPFVGSQSNEDRALSIAAAVQRLKTKLDLTSLISLGRPPHEAATEKELWEIDSVLAP